MGKQSGFPTRRTDLSDLPIRLKLSKLPSEADEKTKWQRRYDARHYNLQYIFYFITIIFLY